MFQELEGMNLAATAYARMLSLFFQPDTYPGSPWMFTIKRASVFTRRPSGNQVAYWEVSKKKSCLSQADWFPLLTKTECSMWSGRIYTWQMNVVHESPTGSSLPVPHSSPPGKTQNNKILASWCLPLLLAFCGSLHTEATHRG